MNRYSSFRSALCRGLAALLVAAALIPATAAKPNFIFILVDDLGWTDLGFMGSQFYETPRIDQLAAQGMRFTSAYSACTVCSPTRAAYQTGKYPARLHITDWIQGHKRPQAKLSVPDWTMHLPHSETTIAEALKTAGYATIHIGKWHLGNEDHRPTSQGYDRNVGGYFRGQPPSYFAPYNIPTLEEGPDGEYLTDREAEEAVRFIEAHQDEPFFLSLPHYTVHTPLQAKQAKIDKYREKAAARPASKQRNPTYAAMIESLDESTGRILDCLERLNLHERTIVFFTSDNGGLTQGRPLPVTDNSPLRAGKGSSYEGGVRVPLIVKWPGQTEPGSVSGEPVLSIDYLPTILEMAGVSLHSNHASAPDGRSLVPLLTQKGTLNRPAVFWHYPHYHPGGATPYGAVRAGPYKLIQFYEHDYLELYHLGDDISESLNLANQMPWKARELAAVLHQWREEVGAQMPSPNPQHNPAQAASPHYAVQPQENGHVILRARDAIIEGQTLRYEPQPRKDTLGYWTNPEDAAVWLFHLDRSGTFSVEILQGCGPGNGGSEFSIELPENTLRAKVEETGGFQDFVRREVGRTAIAGPGTYTLRVQPKNKTHQAVMDLREVKLVRLND